MIQYSDSEIKGMLHNLHMSYHEYSNSVWEMESLHTRKNVHKLDEQAAISVVYTVWLQLHSLNKHNKKEVN